MKELGGYIELDRYNLPMLHENAVALNCARNCLAYLIRAHKIKKIALPYFLCSSVKNLCHKENVQTSFYHIDADFMPVEINLADGEWLYAVNYYGQLTSEKTELLKQKYGRIIIDNAQAYFDMPSDGIDTIYTCRKFFGVSDGAFLYTDKVLNEDLPVDESFDRMRFLLGRFERPASEFYSDYSANNALFSSQPVKQMSRLTLNLLHGIDYDFVKHKRTENYNALFENLENINALKLKPAKGAFAYPLWLENGADVRKRLLEKKIYIPTLWPNVLDDTRKEDLEYSFAKNILPLPCDQRYGREEMDYLIKEVIRCTDSEN
ncbi:MAG: hypothetical protein ACI4IQ_03520 [Eubacterium sp.]